MSTQPEALKCAEGLEQFAGDNGIRTVARSVAELRRLHEVNAELVEVLKQLVRVNEEHNADWIKVIGTPPGWNDKYLDAARAAIAKATGGEA